MKIALWAMIAVVVLFSCVLHRTSAQDKPVEELFKDGELDPLREKAADSGSDKAKSYSRQGYGHVRQGNTSSEPDPFGRTHAPYGAESYDELRMKFQDRLMSPSWQLGIDMKEPRQIVVHYPDGSAREYWYVLFRIINDNYRTITDTSVRDYEKDQFSGDRDPKLVEVETKEASQGRVEGIPVQTTVDVQLETLSVEALANGQHKDLPTEDDLMKVLQQEARDELGVGNSSVTKDADEERALELARKRYHAARRTYTDVSDPFVLRQIAERENLWEWRDNKREYVLWPASAFQRQIGLAHDFAYDWLLGPRCTPLELLAVGDDGELVTGIRHPAVYDDDGAWAGYFGEGDPLPDGVRLVKDSDPLFGKLTKIRYAAYDVVDRFGRVLKEHEPGYLDARISGGEIIRSDPEHGVEPKLEHLIGTAAKRPAFRRYRAGERILVDWDTEIPLEDAPNQHYRVNGKIVEPAESRFYKAYVEERRSLARGDDPDREIGAGMIRIAESDRYASATVLDESTELFGRRPVGDNIPVKVLDHRGRALTRQIVTYEPGDTVTEDEYRIWAQRFPQSVLERYRDKPLNRRLRAGDFMVGLPKIKMGRSLDEALIETETIRRMVHHEGAPDSEASFIDDYATGRRYSPKSVRPDTFMRDPDGTYFTYREAPVPPGAKLAEGEDYVYAPLGDARTGAVPVPAFDRFGVWEDYLDPVSGERVPLRDNAGKLIHDEQGQILYVKEFEYEWLYVYEFEPELDDHADWRGEYGKDPAKLDMLDVQVVEREGKVTGLALDRVVKTRTFVDPLSGSEMTESHVVRLIVAGERTELAADESVKPASEYLDTAGGESISTRQMSRYTFHFLKAKIHGSATGVVDVTAEDFVDPTRDPATGNRHKLDNNLDHAFRTYDRWTLPPPLVFMKNKKPVVQTRIQTRIGPATRDDGSDAPRWHEQYISERWGAFVFSDIDRQWDYMNVHVRGLRPPLYRRGSNVVEVEVPAHSETGATPIKRSVHQTRWYRQDWVYMGRYERLGDEFENFRDLIRSVREIWYLRSEQESR